MDRQPDHEEPSNFELTPVGRRFFGKVTRIPPEDVSGEHPSNASDRKDAEGDRALRAHVKALGDNAVRQLRATFNKVFRA